MKVLIIFLLVLTFIFPLGNASALIWSGGTTGNATTTNNYYTNYTNIALTNQSDTWADGENITMGNGGWFKGVFNWVISSLTPSSVATFNGTTLWINTTYNYNQTQSAYFYNMSATSGWNDGGTNVYLVTSTDKVGIGTTAPLQPLHVYLGNSTRTYALNYRGGIIIEDDDDTILRFLSPESKTQEIWFGDNTSETSGRIRYEHSGDNMTFWTAGAVKMKIDSSGKVGIGTIAPTQTLSVIGTMNVTEDSFFNNITISSDNYILGEPGIAFQLGNDINLMGGGGTGGGNIILTGGLTNSYIGGLNNGSILLNPPPRNGRVGIGTLTPTQTLEVNGAVNISGNLYVGQNVTMPGKFTGSSVDIANNYQLCFLKTGDIPNAMCLKSSTTNASFLTFHTNTFAIQSANDQPIRFWNSTGQPFVSFSALNSRVGIGVNPNTPTHTLTVFGTMNVTENATFGNHVYVIFNVSAQGFIDRSRWCNMNGSDALAKLMNIKSSIGITTGDINKSSMPSCALAQVITSTEDDKGNIITKTEEGRDIGSYISYLTLVAQEQKRENDKLKNCILTSRDFEATKLCISGMGV